MIFFPLKFSPSLSHTSEFLFNFLVLSDLYYPRVTVFHSPLRHGSSQVLIPLFKDVLQGVRGAVPGPGECPWSLLLVFWCSGFFFYLA